jgi:hypothetical protein
MVTLNIRDLCILNGGAIGSKLEPTSPFFKRLDYVHEEYSKHRES